MVKMKTTMTMVMGMVMMVMMMMVIMTTAVSSSSAAYPEGFGSDIYEVVSMASPACPPRNLNLKDGKEKVKKRVMDISHAYRADLPSWESPHGLGLPITQVASIANGSIANESSMKMGVHSGTHVDAPSHIFQKYLEAGYNVDTLDLDVLNGPALIVDAPRDSNLTAESLQALKLPCGVERVLFRTLNTDRRLMWKKEFDTSYVGFTTEGARWLRENTQIKLVGVDYLSVAAFDSLIPAHVVLLQHRDIILVEGLNLDDVDAGLYNLHCLPLRILNSDGSPIRCIVE